MHTIFLIRHSIDWLRKHPRSFYKFFLFPILFLTRIPAVQRIKVLNNYKMVLNLRSWCDRGIFFTGYIDKDLTQFLQKYLHEDSIFVDIGANSGFFSLLAATRARKGHIYAFEPVPEVYRNLAETIRINHLHNVMVYNLAISDRNGTLNFYRSINSDVSSLNKTDYIHNWNIIKVRATTFPEFVKKHQINTVDIIKIDTEGAELSIIRSSQSLLKRLQPILVVEFANKTAAAFGYHPNELYDLLTQMSYTIYRFRGGKLQKQQKKNYYEENLYCFPAKTDDKGRL